MASIALEAPDQPDVVRLIDALDAYQKPLYPAQSHHGIDLGELARPNVLFAVARDAGGTAIGCGAVVVGARVGELKRMFVVPQCRGRGVAQALLAFLECSATAAGCVELMLETGVRQAEAIALYAGTGYVSCGPFDAYSEDPHSIFMKKELVSPRPSGGEGRGAIAGTSRIVP